MLFRGIFDAIKLPFMNFHDNVAFGTNRGSLAFVSTIDKDFRFTKIKTNEHFVFISFRNFNICNVLSFICVCNIRTRFWKKLNQGRVIN